MDLSASMYACLDTVVRLKAFKDRRSSVSTAIEAELGQGLNFKLKPVTATAISQTQVVFQCPLEDYYTNICDAIPRASAPCLCTNQHVVEIPANVRKDDPSKIVQVIDTSVFIDCLHGAMQRGEWRKLHRFVQDQKYRGLQIVQTPETVIDDEDDRSQYPPAVVGPSNDAPLPKRKMTAAERRACERSRALLALSASMPSLVAGHMTRYIAEIQVQDPFTL